MRKKYVVFSALLTLFAFSSRKPGTHNVPVPYPEGFRNWVHVKTGLIGPKSKIFAQFGGFHHIYANGPALIGYQNGKFPEGSVIVFDKLEMVEDSSGNISEGKRKWVDVMVKDAAADSTGGWSFEEFTGNSRTDRAVRNQAIVKCYNCHAVRKVNDFVFSELKE
ncbi:MAG TPA: cytochrome P460 family protein [Puia sp.]|nr:cytochrome P460 family protein [Puia sp.]